MQNFKCFCTIFLVIVFEIITTINLYSQKVISEYNISTNNSSGDVRLLPYFPDDMVIDFSSSIYVTDKRKQRVIKFDSSGSTLFYINLNEIIKEERLDYKDPKLINLYHVKLAIDSKNNLYLLLLRGEYFRGLFKYDSKGNLNKTFHLEKPFPGARNTGLYINNNMIFITTFPAQILNFSYRDKGLVFVYDLNGNFIGRTNYHIRHKNFVYKPDRDLSNYILQQFEAKDSRRVSKIEQLRKTGEVRIPFTKPHPKGGHLAIEQDLWYVKGIDKFGNLYLANNVMIKKFDKHINLIKEISIGSKQLRKEKVNLDPRLVNIQPVNKSEEITISPRYVRISPAGGIFVVGIKNRNGGLDNSQANTVSELEIVILKIN